MVEKSDVKNRKINSPILAPPSSLSPHSGYIFAHMLVNRNTSLAPAASPFRQNRNSVTHEGPNKAVAA